MAELETIDRDWLADHPLPDHAQATAKDDRGHVIVIGGSRAVPGGLGLAAEAASRAGAGRIQMATVAPLAIPLGLAMPEAGVFALPDDSDGEIDWRSEAIGDALSRSQCVVVGPAMQSSTATVSILQTLLAIPGPTPRIVVDAAAIKGVCGMTGALRQLGERAVLTPNPAELAQALDCDPAQVTRQPEAALKRAADHFGVAIVLKGPQSFVHTPGEKSLSYGGGGIGMATGGSGDVLAGLLGGLLARGAPTRTACAWAVWIHGEAGRLLSESIAPLGYLARELLPALPGLLNDQTVS